VEFFFSKNVKNPPKFAPMNFWQHPLATLQELFLRKTPQLRQVRHFHSEALDREVDIDVYLPPDYHIRMDKRYPLVLFNDGQDLPRMNMSGILEELYLKKRIPYAIIIGVYTSGERHREYGTVRQADYKGRGDKAPQYQKFMLHEFLPWLYRRFRISKDREDIIIAGFSLGGLSAFDIGWATPYLFGKIGVFSGALWWRWENIDPKDPDHSRIIHDVVDKTPKITEHQSYWFQTGTLDEEEDRNNNGVIDAIDDTLDLIKTLKAKGVDDDSIVYYEMEGGEHNTETWGKAMPDFLHWALTSH
jgi:enterochelin esterase-like enzyme